MDNTRSLLTAVNALVAAEDGPEVYADLLQLLPLALRAHARFGGDREVLNPLVELALNNREQFNRVIGLVELKRAQAGMPPLSSIPDIGFDKTEYQKDFMQQKRARERRAAEIENLIRKPADKLRGRARLDFMQAQSRRWKAQRDSMLEDVKVKAGRKLKREELRDMLKQFWAKIDAELDGLEELARAEALKPAYRRVK